MIDLGQSCLQGLYSEPLLEWRGPGKGQVIAERNIKSPVSDMLSLSCLRS